MNPIGPRGVYDEAKRYAEALTMAYHRQQGVDTAIVRIFNSILADEQVLYDDGTELRRETAEEAAARLIPYAWACGLHAAPPAGGRSDLSGLVPGRADGRPGARVPARWLHRSRVRGRRADAVGARVRT